MYKLLLSLLVLAFLGVAFAELSAFGKRLETIPSADEAATLFGKFKVDYNRNYATVEEEAKRFEYFQDSLKRIVELNQKSTTATFSIFRFDDESPEEKATRRGKIVFTQEDLDLQALHKNDTVDSINVNSIDWRNNGMISPVKDQGQCGACWAFTAAEMCEVGNWQNGHGLQILSPQQFVDCANGMNQGCNGGNPMVAIQQMIQNQGGNLAYDSAYPYVARAQGYCYYQQSKTGAHMSSVSSASGEQNIYNVLNYTPVGIFIDATSVESYSSGYLNSGNCEANGVNHLIQAVGMGYWSDGTPVWILKNQWGAGWASYGGYFFVAYGQGACNIQTQGYWSN